jgi:tRNA A-37 threonylcarbamoyl transferase component Bud32
MTGETPATLGRYRIEAELGSGAMGRVYLAHDPFLDRKVAIKTLRSDVADELVLEMKTRFVREAKSAGRLNHPNIVTLYDVDVAGEVAYIAMEYLQGSSLRQLMDAGAPLSPGRIADIVAQIAEALDYAGRFGIVHRDVKPANIMIAPGGLAKLTDFGLARVPSSQMTVKGSILGSPKYMSPEQVREQPLDGRADLFSLGVVLYELLAHRTPFEGPDVALIDLMDNIVTLPVAPLAERDPSVPAAFDAILARALAKDPADRFQRGRDFAEALRALRAGAAGVPFDEPSLGAEDPALHEALNRILGDLETTSRTSAPETLSASLRQGFHFLEALVRRVVQAVPPYTVRLDLAHVGALPLAALSDGTAECHTRELEGREVVDFVALTAVDAEEAKGLRTLLERAGIAHDWREVRDAAGNLSCEAFVIDVDMLATAMLRGDYETQCVEIDCQNFGVLGRVRYRLSRAEFDELIWDLGKLMLGFPSGFAGRRLPEGE